MRKWIVYAEWTMYAQVEVEANSLEEAKDLVLDAPDFPEGRYERETFIVNDHLTSKLNGLPCDDPYCPCQKEKING